MRRTAAGGGVVLALVAMILACGTRQRTASPIITVALASSPVTLDPGLATDEASQKIGQLIFSSLLRVDDNLRPAPDLATRVESPDPKTYVLEVRHGVRFHDGRELTAEDVAFTFRRFLDPAFVSGRKGAYRNLRAVDVLDRYTVAFRLVEPSGAFLINLIMGILPAGSGAEAARRPIGSGPYSIREFVPDDHVSLTPFAAHYAGAPKNQGLTFRVVPDDTMRGLELRRGSVDLVINDLSPDLVAGLKAEGRLRVTTAPGTDYAYVGFNLRDPILRDRRVRQAIGYAIDRQAITTYLRRGFATPAVNLLPPMSWAYAADAPSFTHDVARAQTLLDEAGYRDPDGAGPLPRLRLTLKTSTVEAYRLQAAVIQQNLADAGIAVDVRSYELETLRDDIVKGNMQMYTLQWVGGTDPDILRRVFHSTQVPPNGFNRGRYANAEVDRLIDLATASITESDRAKYYQAAQRLIAADAPYISLWHKTNLAVYQPSLDGVTLSPTAEFTFLKDVARR